MAKKNEIEKVESDELAAVTTQDVEARMIMLRNQPVLIDADVAALYGVETREVNQAVRNNPKKFPYGYIFELDKYEKEEVVKNFDHLNNLIHFSLFTILSSLNPKITKQEQRPSA